MRGEKPLTRELLRKISDALAVSPEYFVEGRREAVHDAILTDDRLMERFYRELRRDA
jgi:hypothetical protein